MKTKIFYPKQIKKAAELIKKGELIAFPTETVYGLGANALDSKAIRKIFLAKGRPQDNPLIVHISKKEEIENIAKVEKSKKELIEKLAGKFWPGPLTIILKKKPIISKRVSAGLDTIAIRMPKNKIALDLIKFSQVPIAAPSANISGKPSGTCFEHVLEDFNKKISGIIKSKECDLGIESTVIDLTSKKPLLLRPGGVNFEELKKIIPDLEIGLNKKNKKKSPGMKYKHYSPKAEIFLFKSNNPDQLEKYKRNLEKQNKKVIVVESSNTNSFAKNLFKIFRDTDKNKADILLIPSIEEKGIGLSIMNRLKKASSKTIY